MLQAIRERAQGIIAWVIVILIVIPFALWGINQYFHGDKEVPVAKVNGASISKDELQSAFLQQRQRLQQMMGQNFRPEMFAEGPMKKEILDGLIEHELITQAAQKAGMRVSNAAMAGLIRSIPAFQANGKFSPELYERALRSQGMSPQGFEAQLRGDLLVEQLRSGIEQSAFTTAPELDRYLRLQNQTRDFGFLLFPVEKFAAKVQVGDDEVKRFYGDNKARFMQPEMVRVAYIELSTAKLAAETPVPEAQIRAYYEAHPEEFSQPESRRASHILFRVAPGASPQAEQAARKKAEDALKRLRGGESFEKLAKQVSEDPGSAKRGGDLGFFERGTMDKAFEEKVFSLKKGELSGLVRSAFGYHIIRLDDIRGGGTKPFDQVRDQIRQKLGAEKAQERFYDLADKLNNLTYEHPDTLQNASDELKLPIQHSGYFARSGGTDIAANPKVVQAAFSEDVLERGNNSDSIDLGTDHVVVLRVEDRRPEAQRPLEEVRSQIVDQLRREKARTEARAAADKAVQSLKAGQEPVTIAKSEGVEWKTAKAVMRNDTQLPHPVVETAFHMPRPKASVPALDRTSLPTGDEAVVVLLSVKDGSGSAPADKVKEKSAPVTRADAEASYDGMVATLRKEGKIEISKDQM